MVSLKYLKFMTEQTSNLTNKLKTIDIHTLENIIAQAVSEAVDVELNCRIHNINYDSNSGYHGAEFAVSLAEPIEKLFGFDFSAKSRSSAGSGNE